jgi:hypothetical protein
MWLTLLSFFRSWKVVAATVSIAAALGLWAYVGHLQNAIHAKDAALREASAALKVCSAQIADRDETIRSNAEGERQDATANAKFWKGQNLAAFNAGARSHRCPGEPVGVSDDLRAIWEQGAFIAAPGLPGKP